VDEEQVAPPVGERFQSLPCLVELRLLFLDAVPQREQRVEVRSRVLPGRFSELT
jgi:hypothetical protein